MISDMNISLNVTHGLNDYGQTRWSLRTVVTIVTTVLRDEKHLVTVMDLQNSKITGWAIHIT